MIFVRLWLVFPCFFPLPSFPISRFNPILAISSLLFLYFPAITLSFKSAKGSIGHVGDQTDFCYCPRRNPSVSCAKSLPWPNNPLMVANRHLEMGHYLMFVVSRDWELLKFCLRTGSSCVAGNLPPLATIADTANAVITTLRHWSGKKHHSHTSVG